MAYGQRPGQDGEQGQWRGNDGRSLPPQWGYGQQDDAQGPGGHGQRGYDRGEQQAGGDGRWQPPEWRYGQQRYEQGNGQRGYAPGQPTAHFQPMPPSQPGQRGFGPPGPQPPYQPPQRGKSWPARHKALTGILAFVALIIVIIVAANSGKSPSSPGSSVAAGMKTTASATATGVHSQHATQPAAAVQKTHPTRTQTTSAVSHAPAPSAPAPTTPAAVVAPPASAAPASCHPLTNGSKCYEPGEYCRNADHGASGVAGDGKAITCENNDGWRWEPA
jgi:hypothetical protein